ncbi:MAG TPA: polysaccharide biosynthesis protein, partial [Longimicrobiales bacterium]|nr:polysaccharide biosynthesis protein [Longimicrobiales bacterium]
VFVTKMPVVRILDLAEVMIEEVAPRCGFSPGDVSIEVVGAKPGEKLYEELLNEEEVRRAIELPKYFVVQPALPPLFHPKPEQYSEPTLGAVSRAYNSAVDEVMPKEELRAYLQRFGLLEAMD